MRYSFWSGVKEREPRAFHEKAYRRQTLALWDARWLALSGQARYFFLYEVKGPLKKTAARSDPPGVSIDRFPPHILKELADGGFVEIQAAKSRTITEKVVASSGIYDFAVRVRTLRRLHLLAA